MVDLEGTLEMIYWFSDCSVYKNHLCLMKCKVPGLNLLGDSALLHLEKTLEIHFFNQHQTILGQNFENHYSGLFLYFFQMRKTYVLAITRYNFTSNYTNILLKHIGRNAFGFVLYFPIHVMRESKQRCQHFK